MRYAIISDIHSNIEAFSSVLQKIDALKADRIISLGDIVGYNANPNECIELLKKRNILSIMGNHDSRASGLEEPYDFNAVAKEAIFWTREKLTRENKEFLGGLPRRLVVDHRFAIVHGSIDSTDTYILSENDAFFNFNLMHTEGLPDIAFFGHTHIKISYVQRGRGMETTTANHLDVEKGTRFLLNPGAVGQPRDGNPLASFLVYDSKKGEISSYRTRYDIALCMDKIIRSGLPRILAERLEEGY